VKYNSYVFRIVPKAHADATMFTKSGRAYTPKKKKDYQKRILNELVTLRQDFDVPIVTPVIAVWTFFLLRPSGVHKTVGVKSTRPDTDGFLKTTKDAIQAGPLSRRSKKPLIGLGLIQDDALIFCETVQKIYTSNPNQQLTSLILWTKPESLQGGKIRNFPWRICPKEILQYLSTLAD
jgi:Holliday junction resolvase RusA-like endonuclease